MIIFCRELSAVNANLVFLKLVRLVNRITQILPALRITEAVPLLLTALIMVI